VVNILNRLRVNVLGLVLNEVKPDSSNGYYHHGYFGLYHHGYYSKYSQEQDATVLARVDS
jgi:hypothetical protein